MSVPPLSAGTSVETYLFRGVVSFDFSSPGWISPFVIVEMVAVCSFCAPPPYPPYQLSFGTFHTGEQKNQRRHEKSRPFHGSDRVR